ncbi:MAG TPA: hypothetical protein VHC98_03795 [Candidatus Saccharimonadales bacterium]|nr:hypothetical protein [Candidatus Saccharimonadales bacterium]
MLEIRSTTGRAEAIRPNIGNEYVPLDAKHTSDLDALSGDLRRRLGVQELPTPGAEDEPTTFWPVTGVSALVRHLASQPGGAPYARRVISTLCHGSLLQLQQEFPTPESAIAATATADEEQVALGRIAGRAYTGMATFFEQLREMGIPVDRLDIDGVDQTRDALVQSGLYDAQSGAINLARIVQIEQAFGRAAEATA